MADVDIEHDRIAIVTLSLYQILKVRLDWFKSLRQRLSFLNGIDRKVNRSDSRIAQTIDHIGLHQPAIGRQVNKNVFLGAVVNNFVDELWTQQIGRASC